MNGIVCRGFALAVGIAALYGQTDAKTQYELGLRYEKAEDFAQGAAQGTAMAVMNAKGRGMGKAAEWYQRAAAQGLDDAQYNLGALYESGRVLSKNLAKAAQYYRAVAGQGDSTAQPRLSMMCANGDGVARDFVAGPIWLSRAATRTPRECARN